jgi:hypothetical protein
MNSWGGVSLLSTDGVVDAVILPAEGDAVVVGGGETTIGSKTLRVPSVWTVRDLLGHPKFT